MSNDIINKSYINVKVEAADWREAIRAAGKLLVENNKITNKYVEAMIEAVEKYGPYIVIMPGIAFAHARPSEEVKEECLSLITLKETVEFGAEDNDPVYAVFAFGATSDQGHLEALSNLVGFLESEENLTLLKEGTDIEKLYKKINKR